MQLWAGSKPHELPLWVLQDREVGMIITDNSSLKRY